MKWVSVVKSGNLWLVTTVIRYILVIYEIFVQNGYFVLKFRHNTSYLATYILRELTPLHASYLIHQHKATKFFVGICISSDF